MKLYPRLPLVVASSLAERRRSMSISNLRDLSGHKFATVIYAPTGGSRVEENDIAALDEVLRSVAHAAGYPHTETEAARRHFDREAAPVLHRQMEISASEASRVEIWAFLTCVVVPDLVRWRFPGGAEGTSQERFIGGARGLRNMLGRLWWRAFTLYDGDREDPYHLVRELGEDELVQIMERPAIAGSRRLAKRLAALTVKSGTATGGQSRSDTLREATKKVRRLLAILETDLMSDNELDGILMPLFG